MPLTPEQLEAFDKAPRECKTQEDFSRALTEHLPEGPPFSLDDPDPLNRLAARLEGSTVSRTK